MNSIILSKCISKKSINTYIYAENELKKTHFISLKKRFIFLKKNINKLSMISNSDIKEHSDLLKKFNEIYNKESNLLLNQMKNTLLQSNLDDDENIFIKKTKKIKN